MTTRRLIRIGLLFSGALIILVWGLNFLKGKNFLQTEKEYYACYETIGGLMISSPVTLKGFKIGDVRDIELSKSNYETVIVKFVITYPNLELPVGTEARIYSMDLMGTKGIRLMLSDSSALHPYQDTLPGSIEGDLKDQVNTQMLPLKRKAEDLMSSMDSVLIALQLVFDQQNRSNLSQSFEIVTQTLRNFEQTSVYLDTFVQTETSKFSFILDNLDSLAIQLVMRTNELQNTFVNLETLTDSLNQLPIRRTVIQLNEALTSTNQLISNLNDGEGSLGKLIINDSLYYSIEAASLSLNRLLNDIRLNPKRYVRLSAIDWGKTFIVSDNQELMEAMSGEQELHYYACILTSTAPLDENHPIFSDFRSIQFLQVGSSYYYFLTETTQFDKARRIIQKHIHDYPEAAVFTWLDGKWIRVPV